MVIAADSSSRRNGTVVRRKTNHQVTVVTEPGGSLKGHRWQVKNFIPAGLYEGWRITSTKLLTNALRQTFLCSLYYILIVLVCVIGFVVLHRFVTAGLLRPLLIERQLNASDYQQCEVTKKINVGRRYLEPVVSWTFLEACFLNLTVTVGWNLFGCLSVHQLALLDKRRLGHWNWLAALKLIKKMRMRCK